MEGFGSRRDDSGDRRPVDATHFDHNGDPLPEEPYYCPGCGRRYTYMTECRGKSDAAPHPPIVVVSTGELAGDPADHTPAPDTGT